MGLDRSYAVVFRRVGVNDPKVGKKPMIVGTCYYEARPELMALADPNPYARSTVSNDIDIPEGNISDLVFEHISKMKARSNSEKTEQDMRFSTMDDFIDGDWGEMDVERSVREEAKNNPQMQRILDALDRYYDETQETTAEDIELLKANDIIMIDEDADDIVPLSEMDVKLRQESQREEARVRTLTAADFPENSVSDPSVVRKLSSSIKSNRQLLDRLEKEMTASMAVTISEENEDRREILAKLEKLKG